MATEPPNPDVVRHAAELETKRQELIERLRRGDALIRDAKSPAEQARFERHWLELLAEYERVCDEIARLQGLKTER